jgi:hypothetical protein
MPCAYGVETGRTFLVDGDGDILQMSTNGYQFDDVAVEDDGNEHVWTEFKDADGELTYVSDHEAYALTADEFGPIPDMAYNHLTKRYVPLAHSVEEQGGRWYIQMGYAGFNSRANNLNGYPWQTTAMRAVRRYQQA